jgi:hypothetical protein
MSLRKRISSSRERRAQAQAKRRAERRRAERAKASATAPERAKARSERRAGAASAKATAKTKDTPTAASKATSKSSKAKPKSGKPAPKSKLAASKRGRAVAAEGRKLGAGVASVGVEVLKLGREMLAIPVQLWLAAAEIAGAFVLRVWLRAIRPLLVALWRLGLATLRLAQRYVTPARGVAAVTLVALGALAASQWLDYHSVSVGTDAYSGAVGAVAPAPEVESEIAGNAHGWVMLPLAVAGLVAVVVSLTGRRRRAAVLLVPIGIAVIVISLAVDVPKGLDEGPAAVAYEGASASLLEGFWMQIATAVVLIACGLLLPRYLRPASARATKAVEHAGPSLFQKLAAAIQKGRRGRPNARRKRPRIRPKRKVQGAGT